MKYLYSILLFASLAGCATPHSGPTADVGSTFVAMEAVSGAQELNPIAGVAGLTGGAVISLGARLAINRHYRGKEDCPTVAGWTNAVGWGAACNNLAVVAGAAPMVSVPLLIGCAIAAKKTRADKTEAWCGSYELTDLPCSLGNLPGEAQSARCIDNRLAWK